MTKISSFTGTLCIMLVFGVVVQSCDNLRDSEITEGAGGRYSTPYADAELLEQLAAQEGAVDWRVARFFALTDMLDFTEENNWYGRNFPDIRLLFITPERMNRGIMNSVCCGMT
ncbi:MAG: hypothetical protein LBC53_01465 [Spirochaetaceae bacterium]|jgi:hypothetical protein|nr:hypothetical protein [Spirochaetaceae bacterium]